jgi:hypothetical protein
MLAFDDAALARLVRATSKISQRKRGRFLRKIANELDPSPNAVRLRNARQRRETGIGYYRLALNEVAVEELLSREGLLLLPGRDYSRAEVEIALAEFITRLCAFDMHVEPESGNDL